ncbi:hypothetical protein, partial [Ensifer aridi]|uniref:hypothetical protein n=1 Tax=Ensifer aridi TaxID=1708715 RepID=UPI001969EC85
RALFGIWRALENKTPTMTLEQRSYLTIGHGISVFTQPAPIAAGADPPVKARLGPRSGNNCRSTHVLTDAQSQGTKVTSTFARDGKTEGIQRQFD